MATPASFAHSYLRRAGQEGEARCGKAPNREHARAKRAVYMSIGEGGRRRRQPSRRLRGSPLSKSNAPLPARRSRRRRRAISPSDLHLGQIAEGLPGPEPLYHSRHVQTREPAACALKPYERLPLLPPALAPYRPSRGGIAEYEPTPNARSKESSRFNGHDYGRRFLSTGGCCA